MTKRSEKQRAEEAAGAGEVAAAAGNVAAEETPDAAGGLAGAAVPAAPVVEVETLKDRLVRLQADFDNFRKRMAREREETVRRANENLMVELLAVLDNMDYGLRHASEHEHGESFAEGLRLIAGQLEAVLGRFGLQPVDAEGQPFDPHLHEAVQHIPSDVQGEGMVISQTRRGYVLGSKLLRPAVVVVSSGPPSGVESGGGAGEPGEQAGPVVEE